LSEAQPKNELVNSPPQKKWKRLHLGAQSRTRALPHNQYNQHNQNNQHNQHNQYNQHNPRSTTRVRL
jgi:hypothetical protein